MSTIHASGRASINDGDAGTTDPADAPGHCTRLAAGDKWPDASCPEKMYQASGSAFDTAIRVFAAGETLEFAAGTLGEEVGAILDGRFEILAAGEHYTLSRGEAILIPPAEARRFCCVSERGVLYRVTNRAALLDAAEAQAGQS